MNPKQITIREFFTGEKHYNIPVYQRAYSWESRNWKVFLDDLKESIKGENRYFFGNILVEKLNNIDYLDIIDGQQRITTIIIFARAVLNVLKEVNFALDETLNSNELLKYIEEDFLIYRNIPKLHAVDYDNDFFYNTIIKDLPTHNPQTPSQKNILEAKDYFYKELKKMQIGDILKILEIIKKSSIISVEFQNKRDSILMFELQNNRGKELTNMEKLKSYLSYQLYVYLNEERCEMELNNLTDVFKNIYKIINDIKIASEDEVLKYFNESKFGFSYRENDNDLNYKKYLNEAENKIEWIKNYVTELKIAFVDFKDFQNSNNQFKEYLIYLDVATVYPFIIKAYSIYRNDFEKLNEIFKALEIIAFRDRMVKTRANLASRLNSVLKNFNSLENLINKLKQECNDKNSYWRDENMINMIYNIYHDNYRVIPYILLRYENYLRDKNATTRGYLFSIKEIIKPSIEHIAPEDENKDINSGYCDYDEEFINSYLDSIGNLLLLPQSHNSSIGNCPFEEKQNSYKNSPLLHMREISGYDKWDKNAINKRNEKFINFIISTWSYK